MNSGPQSANKKNESGKRPFIGTISINFNAPDFNYGAILHSWAFQQYLIKSGLAEKTEIIDFKMPKVHGKKLIPVAIAATCVFVGVCLIRL